MNELNNEFFKKQGLEKQGAYILAENITKVLYSCSPLIFIMISGNIPFIYLFSQYSLYLLILYFRQIGMFLKKEIDLGQRVLIGIKDWGLKIIFLG